MIQSSLNILTWSLGFKKSVKRLKCLEPEVISGQGSSVYSPC